MFIYKTTKNYGPDVSITGWTYQGSIGLFDSYASALADSMGLWEEYCAYFRNGGSR